MKDPEACQAEKIRDEAVEWLKQHRRECNNPDCREPANFLAFLGHALGLRSADDFKEQLEWYAANCPKCPTRSTDGLPR